MIRNDRYPRAEIASMPRIQLFVGMNKRQLCHFSGFLLVVHEPQGSIVHRQRVPLHQRVKRTRIVLAQHLPNQFYVGYIALHLLIRDTNHQKVTRKYNKNSTI